MPNTEVAYTAAYVNSVSSTILDKPQMVDILLVNTSSIVELTLLMFTFI